MFADSTRSMKSMSGSNQLSAIDAKANTTPTNVHCFSYIFADSQGLQLIYIDRPTIMDQLLVPLFVFFLAFFRMQGAEASFCRYIQLFFLFCFLNVVLQVAARLYYNHTLVLIVSATTKKQQQPPQCFLRNIINFYFC